MLHEMDEFAERDKLRYQLDDTIRLILDHVVREGWKLPYFLDIKDSAGSVLAERLKLWAGVGWNIEVCHASELTNSVYFAADQLLSAVWPITVHLEEAFPSDGGGLSPREYDHHMTLRWRKLDLALSAELLGSMARTYDLIWGAIRDTSSNEERRRKEPSAPDITFEPLGKQIGNILGEVLGGSVEWVKPDELAPND